MKSIYLLLITVFCFFKPLQTDYLTEITKWQTDLNEEFKNPEESPLPDKERKKFKGLEFFAIDPTYRIEAKFTRTPDETPFTMPTTTDRKPVYVKYGYADFELEGKAFHFPIYQNLQLSQTEEYKDYLFAPFTDLTNGTETYGGGRYMDLKIPASDSLIILDFNKAYNPYCAYSDKYSCPIPPRQNDLEINIKAGVKAWAKNH